MSGQERQINTPEAVAPWSGITGIALGFGVATAGVVTKDSPAIYAGVLLFTVGIMGMMAPKPARS